MKCSLIDEYVKKPSAHGMNTFNGSSVTDVYICHTNFAKKWNEICIKQLAGGKCMENNCFMRTLKLEMISNATCFDAFRLL